MAIQAINVHGEILEADLTPAVGTVTFRITQELRDTVDNIVLTPTDFTATLDVNGEFTITLPTTDNPDITPLDWAYQVYVSVATWRESYWVQLPFALGPTAEFADLIPLDDPETCTPDGTACAPISLVGQVSDLEADLDTVEVTVGALVGQVNTITPIVLQSQADVVILQGQVAAIQANAGLIGPTAFVTLTPIHANITVVTAVPPQTRLERGGDATRFRGFLQATGAVPASTVLANIATVAHRPLHNVSTGVRYTAGSSRFQVAPNGDVTLGSALALNDQVWLDAVTFDLVA